jgi:plastocyanin
VRARLIAVALVVTASLGTLAACGGDDGDTAPVPVGPQPIEDVRDERGKAAGAPPVVEVAAVDDVFEPENVRIDPGVTVRWSNEGENVHDVKRSNSLQDFGAPFGVSGSEFGPGATYEFTFAEPGVYRYFCSLHGSEYAGMIGAVIVGDVDPNAPVVTRST